jgi:hypothetical protein
MENKKAPKRLGEISQKRDLFSKHYLNDDGTYTAEISLGMVHYKDENDDFQEISVDLFDEDDFDEINFPVTKEKKASFKARKEIAKGLKEKLKEGEKLQRDDSDFHGLKVPFDATIPKRFKKGYSIGKGSSRLTFKPEGANAVKGELISKNEIKYAGAWDHADVILELKDKGIKETIILQDPAAPNIFTFEVTGPLQDDLTAGELRMDPAWLVDAAGERRDVETKIRKQGARTYVDLVADVYGLVYPIEIDPTVTIQPDEATSKDIWLNGGQNTTNMNLDQRLYAGADSGGYIGYSMLQFDLSGIVEAEVKKVELQLFYYQAGLFTVGPHPVEVREVPNVWSETTATYSNNYTNYGPTVAVTNVGNTAVWSSWDITSYALKWLKGTVVNNGVFLAGSNTSNNARVFFSSAAGTPENRPKLVVTYQDPPTAPAVTVPNGGELWNGLHTITWNPSTDPIDELLFLTTTTITNTLSTFNGDVEQAFTVPKGKNLYRLDFYLGSQNTNPFTIEIKDSTRTTVLYSTTLTPNGAGATTAQEFSVYPDLGILSSSSDTILVLKIIGNGLSAKGVLAAVYPAHDFYVNGSAYTDRDMALKVYERKGIKQSELKYQIQLSSDNGSTWKEILALSAAGVTSHAYDFTNEPASTQSKIRIRAFDGSAYGSWDESNAAFEIKHNAPPGKPGSTSPSGTSLTPGIVTTLTPTLTWAFNDPDAGNTQASFQVLVYTSAGALKHDSGQVTGSAGSYVVPAGAALAWKTKYYWRVRTWDNSGEASVYSDDQYFLTNQGPTANITNPSAASGVGTVFNDTLQPTFSWSYSDADGDVQKSVQILIKDGSTTVFDSGEIVTTGTTYQIPGTAGIIYDKTYTTQIRAKDNNNTWGAYSALKYFHLNRSPGAPTNLSPAGTSSAPAIIQDNLQPVISWTFNDPDSTDLQDYFRVQIFEDPSGSLIHDSQPITGNANSYAVPAAVLLSGKKYKYKVVYRDHHQLWSGGIYNDSTTAINTSQQYNYFYTNSKPSTPLNPSPAGGSAAGASTVFDDLTPTLSWQFGDPNSGDTQKAFQLKLYNEAGTLLLDTGEVVSAAGSYEIPAANKLTYSQKYQWEVRTKDQLDAWSNYTSRGWLTPKVGTPSGLSASADNFGAKIIIDWTDSLSENLQGYNIYRATASGGPYTKINDTLITQSVYNDSQISTGTTYFYKVEAYVNATEISPLSAAVSAAAIFSSWYIGDFKFIGPTSMSGQRPRAQSKRAVLGKTKKVIQDRGFLGEILDLELYLSNDEYSTGKAKFDAIMAELEKTTALSVRDPFGQVWKVAPGDVSWDLLPGTGTLTYKISFPLEEVN